MRSWIKKIKEDINSEFTQIPEVLNKSYLPSLDGLRAISITIVILAHLYKQYVSQLDLNPIIRHGYLGVYIFFVISGFLITTLLLKEKVNTKNISLKNFYIRRFFRILPLIVLYVVAIFVLDKIFQLEIPSVVFFGVIFFVANLNYFNRTELIGHFWSLAYEEQYYLFFPFLLKKNHKLFTIFILSTLVVFPVFVFVLGFFNVLPWPYLKHALHYTAQFIPLLVGSLFTLLLFKKNEFFNFFRKHKTLMNIVLLILIFGLNIDKEDDVFLHYIKTIKNVFVCACIGLLIVLNLEKKGKDYFYVLLNTGVLRKIGVLSYSLYIWQQLFTVLHPKLPTFFSSFPLNLVLLFVVSVVSYYFYEKKFLKLKNRFK